MNNDQSTTERRIDSEFGSGVTPPHRPRPLLGRTGGEGEAWAVESRSAEDSAESAVRYRCEHSFVPGEQYAGESSHAGDSDTTGYRTSPFIVGEDEEERE